MEDLQVTLDYNYDYDYTPKFSVFGDNIFGRSNIILCVSIILVILTNAFLMIAIFLDRKSHGKTRSLSLLNYMLNYALFTLFVYFQNIHLQLFLYFPTSACAFIFMTHSVLDEGSKYFLFPICCDFIVKYFQPSKYGNRKFLIIQYAVTGILWAFLWVKGLVMFLACSVFSPERCNISINSNFITIMATFSILMITMLVYIGLLIYIAIKGRQCEMMKSPLRTLIIVVILAFISYLQQNLFELGVFPSFDDQTFLIYRYSHFVSFLVMSFLWILDATIRQSARKLCSKKCKESTDHSSHDITELN
ncbi:uncharacterized protein LOC115220941 isoform X1 [Octopus sinensis]|uniref:Uncharacterized protein LOC115220941 isoform X1 n=1 Tax=Octopus sinensis TaxID=2607531 RepID=A0A7E6FHD8_9MOLL|nr:uncharacterized protein LOC115220941 isoform X1 [Octopus sinensis]